MCVSFFHLATPLKQNQLLLTTGPCSGGESCEKGVDTSSRLPLSEPSLCMPSLSPSTVMLLPADQQPLHLSRNPSHDHKLGILRPYFDALPEQQMAQPLNMRTVANSNQQSPKQSRILTPQGACREPVPASRTMRAPHDFQAEQLTTKK